MRFGAHFIDVILRSRQRVYEFSTDPECIFRIQLQQSPHDVTIKGTNILKGDPILVIHFWNEHMPKLPKEGPDLQWALLTRRLTLYSLKLLAKEMQSDEKYAPVRALYGASVLFSFTGHIGGMRMVQRLGFTVLPYQSRRGQFGVFWQNFFSWWLMYTYNDVSLHTREFWSLQRTEIWMLSDEFLHRFGNPLSA
jgi:hypothetical protein